MRSVLFSGLVFSAIVFAPFQALGAEPRVGDWISYQVNHRQQGGSSPHVAMEFELTREVISIDPGRKQMTLRVRQSGTARQDGASWPIQAEHTEVVALGCFGELVELNGSVESACQGVGGQMDGNLCRVEKAENQGSRSIAHVTHYADLPGEAIAAYSYSLTESDGGSLVQQWRMKNSGRAR